MRHLTPSEVLRIRRAVAIRNRVRRVLRKYTSAALAEDLGVDISTINNVIRGKNHKGVRDEKRDN